MRGRPNEDSIVKKVSEGESPKQVISKEGHLRTYYYYVLRVSCSVWKSAMQKCWCSFSLAKFMKSCARQ